MTIKKLYIDLCVYNRPFDNQKDIRISLETKLFLSLLEQIEKNKYITINSTILEYENQNNPHLERRDKITDYLSLAKEKVELTDNILKRAIFLENLNFESLDALHIASAKEAVNYFITCDDALLKKAEKHKEFLKVNVINLIDFLAQEVKTQW